MNNFNKISFTHQIIPLKMMAFASLIGNKSKLMADENDPTIKNYVGSAADVALQEFALKLGKYDNEYTPDEKDFEWYSKILKRESQSELSIPFNSRRKCWSTLAEMRSKGEDERILFIGGNAEILLNKKCSYLMLEDGKIISLSGEDKNIIKETIETIFSKGLRCVGLGYKKDLGVFKRKSLEDLEALTKDDDKCQELESDCILLGLVTLQNTPKPGVKKALASCEEAGIYISMMTGGNMTTSRTLVQQLGFCNNDETDTNHLCIEGSDFNSLHNTKSKLELIEKGVRILSRATPDNKAEFVSILKENLGKVVAVVGSGTNSAPAIARADIGISMGIAGTKIAQNASKMILLDDNFSSIVNAIEESRSIFG